jgi:hypothetical protein
MRRPARKSRAQATAGAWSRTSFTRIVARWLRTVFSEGEVCDDLVLAESPDQLLEHLVLSVAELGEEHAAVTGGRAA